MPLKLRVGRKGYIILPKAVREAVGIDEGDEVIVEISDGIILRPAKRRVKEEEIRKALRAHLKKLREIRGQREPKPGELAGAYLEEEFEQ
ncbi:MAG: AbrB/MazE/SpoVT family DNA-binding domain-containing protein [Desulfurococcales archaeon]|nr:AbrB/MazE/SpoVT family DNA-binding domain-containing protein [Desulfurococcales archaeon]